MQTQQCAHQWEMVNTWPGFILTETCHKCSLVSTYFSREDNPPLEEYRDGEHFWNVMCNAQSIRFDLKCRSCNTLVTYDELSSLMLCTDCKTDCKVSGLLKKYSEENIWIYVAFGFRPFPEKKQLSDEKITILEDYFNQRRKSSGSSIKIVSYEMIDDLDSCTGEFIMDTSLLSLTAPET